MSPQSNRHNFVSLVCALVALAVIGLSSGVLLMTALAQDAEAQPAVFLPLVAGSDPGGSPGDPATVTQTPTQPATPVATITTGATLTPGTTPTPGATPTPGTTATSGATPTPGTTATPDATSTSTATATPTTTPPAEPLNGAWFMEPYTKTGGADIQVDLHGGLHIAYRYHVPDQEGTAAVYLYCPAPVANCEEMGRWQGVKMLDLVREVQLELTADGRPRLLIKTQSAGYSGEGEDYHYAECNQQCTNPQQWTVTHVATRYDSFYNGVGGYYLPDRYFALDPAGRPRFVYSDRNYHVEPDHYGVYYLWCDAVCTESTSWQEVRISRQRGNEYVDDYEILEFPALAFTRDGRPRIVGDLIPMADQEGERDIGIYYFACDTLCHSSDSWQRTKIAERGQGLYPMWDIELDSFDRPRVAFYKGSTPDGDDSSRRLHYLQCNDNCLSASNWQSLNLGLPYETGEGADLALDANGLPRIAYLDGRYNLGYSWCNGDCLTLSNWRHLQADLEVELEADYPVTRPVTCDAGIWRTHSPVLRLDATGNPRIAYDAGYKGRCWYQDPHNPDETYYVFIEIWHAVRVVWFNQP